MHELVRPRNPTSPPAASLPAPPGRTRALLRRAGVAFVLLLAAACGRREPASPWDEARLARMTPRQKAMQLLVARVPPLAPPAPGDSSRA
ncbi:MAG TPA: hypothetical protein VF771_19680, partial [Longimicrobiaceae bacterium]